MLKVQQKSDPEIRIVILFLFYSVFMFLIFFPINIKTFNRRVHKVLPKGAKQYISTF